MGEGSGDGGKVKVGKKGFSPILESLDFTHRGNFKEHGERRRNKERDDTMTSGMVI
jgi:hypothetical protein